MDGLIVRTYARKQASKGASKARDVKGGESYIQYIVDALIFYLFCSVPFQDTLTLHYFCLTVRVRNKILH